MFKASLTTWTIPTVLSMYLPAHAETSCGTASLIVGNWVPSEPLSSGGNITYRFNDDKTGEAVGADSFGLGFGFTFTWQILGLGLTLDLDELNELQTFTISEDCMRLVSENGTLFIKRT